MKVVMYCRVAHDNNFVLEQQKTALQNYALAQGYTVLDTISDVANGVSSDRPGLQELKAVVRAGGIDAVLVASASHPYRSPIMNLGFKHFLEANGVKMLSQMDGNMDETEAIMKAMIAQAKIKSTPTMK